MAATSAALASGNATTYRTCPRSGLQFERSAERLMIFNAVTAVVALLVGGILAIGVVLARRPLAGRRHLLHGAHRPRHRHAHLLDDFL